MLAIALLAAAGATMAAGTMDVALDCKEPGGWRFDVSSSSPESGVEVVRVVMKSASERVFCVYQPNLAVDVGKPDRRVVVVNGAFTDSVVLDLPSVPSKAAAFDAFGRPAPLQALKPGVNRVHLPKSGYVQVEW